jgi:hypothetical protein
VGAFARWVFAAGGHARFRLSLIEGRLKGPLRLQKLQLVRIPVTTMLLSVYAQSVDSECEECYSVVCSSSRTHMFIRIFSLSGKTNVAERAAGRFELQERSALEQNVTKRPGNACHVLVCQTGRGCRFLFLLQLFMPSTRCLFNDLVNDGVEHSHVKRLYTTVRLLSTSSPSQRQLVRHYLSFSRLPTFQGSTAAPQDVTKP